MPEIDWCARAEELRAKRDKIVSGEGIQEVSYGEDRVRFGKSDMDRLDVLIREAEKKCAESQGKRSRYARRVRVRPY